MGAADFGNGISRMALFEELLFINPDLTVYLHRLPVGEWVALDASTHLEQHGVGLAQSALWDVQGPLGRSLQSLLLDAPLRSVGPLGYELLALDLVQPAPDAVRLSDADGVGEARLPDGARPTDALGPVLPLELLFLPLEVRGREEHLGLRPTAGSLELPDLLDTLCTHVASPSRTGTLRSGFHRNKG